MRCSLLPCLRRSPHSGSPGAASGREGDGAEDRQVPGQAGYRALDSPQFGGKQAEWERAIQARSQSQNEYVRIQ